MCLDKNAQKSTYINVLFDLINKKINTKNELKTLKKLNLDLHMQFSNFLGFSNNFFMFMIHNKKKKYYHNIFTPPPLTFCKYYCV